MIVKLQLVFLVVLYSLSQYACNGTENSNLKMEGLLNRDAKLLISGGFSGEEIKIRVDAKDVGSIKSAETDSVLGVASTFDIESHASEGSKVKIIVIKKSKHMSELEFTFDGHSYYIVDYNSIENKLILSVRDSFPLLD